MKELEHYTIGESYGGSQDWFRTIWMNRGGCGAITACDCCIYLAKYKNMRSLYPFDPEHILQEDFLTFGEMMRTYLSPRPHGINRTKTFMDGFSRYLATCRGENLRMTSVEGDEDVEVAVRTIREQIDRGYPVPYLMLLHHDKAFSDYNWHWFLVNGYDDADGGFRIKAVTYGEWEWLDLFRLWDTGHRQKGGFVVLSV